MNKRKNKTLYLLFLLVRKIKLSIKKMEQRGEEENWAMLMKNKMAIQQDGDTTITLRKKRKMLVQKVKVQLITIR